MQAISRDENHCRIVLEAVADATLAKDDFREGLNLIGPQFGMEIEYIYVLHELCLGGFSKYAPPWFADYEPLITHERLNAFLAAVDARGDGNISTSEFYAIFPHLAGSSSSSSSSSSAVSWTSSGNDVKEQRLQHGLYVSRLEWTGRIPERGHVYAVVQDGAGELAGVISYGGDTLTIDQSGYYYIAVSSDPSYARWKLTLSPSR